jgi:hypothetical protein
MLKVQPLNKSLQGCISMGPFSNDTIMGGGYISCGEFMGEDKSGSALPGVLRDIPKVLSSAEAADFRKQVAGPLMEAMGRGEQEVEVSATTVSLLLAPLARYHAHLDETLGHPHPHDAPELDRQRGMNMTDAKWGDGLGWQFYCTHDLLRACEVSQKTGAPIVLNFD